MTTEVKTEKKKAEEKEDNNKLDPSLYSCEIVLKNTTLEKADDKTLPTDAYQVWYNIDGKEFLDVTRSCKQANIFDMYYDTYKGDLKRIEYGKGTVSPSMWGYKQPEKKKRRRG